jgi:hypothetical protein
MIQNHFCDTEPFFAEYWKVVWLVFPRTPCQAEPFRGFCVVPDGRTPKKVLQNSFFFFRVGSFLESRNIYILGSFLESRNIYILGSFLESRNIYILHWKKKRCQSKPLEFRGTLQYSQRYGARVTEPFKGFVISEVSFDPTYWILWPKGFREKPFKGIVLKKVS